MSVPLNTVVSCLGRIAPPALAESWDNVGVLLSPSTPRPVSRILLTIDLTRAVAEEAVRAKAELIVAYHPPIFQPLRQLRGQSHGQSHLVRLIEQRTAVYSPHTALDAAPGGVNDWLADGLGEGSRQPLQRAPADLNPPLHKVVVFVPVTALGRVRAAMADAGAGHIGHYDQCSFSVPGFGTFRGDPTTNPAVGQRGRLETVEEVRLEMICQPSRLPDVAQAIRTTHPYEVPAWEIYPLAPRPSPNAGQGRQVTLKKPVPLAALADRVKQHLGLEHVRIAVAESHRRGTIRTIGLCAGAGGSVVGNADADVLLTGEMRHHDILAANERGASVILCEHSNTERGYLPVLKAKMQKILGKTAKIEISKKDRQPLSIA